MKKRYVGLTAMVAVAVLFVSGCEENTLRNPTDGKGGLKLLKMQKYYYDENGNRKDNDTDGIKFYYDEKGRLVKQTEGRSGVGYEYDESGRNTATYNIKHPEFRSTYIYDDAGNVIKRISDSYDDRNGGYFEAVTVYKYDTSITLPKWNTVAHSWIGDARSPLVKKLEDSDGDGVYDRIEAYTNNEHGDHTTWKIKTVYRNKTRLSTGNIKYTYKNGHIKTQKIHEVSQYYYQDKNDTEEYDYTLHYTYNKSGDKTIVKYDSDNDGTIDWQIKYAYDEHGNVASKQELDKKGHIRYESVYIWGTPDQANTQGALPDFYGYSTIMIYTNIQKDSQLYNQYSQMEIAGAQKEFYHGTVSCTDYGFQQKDRQSSNVSANVQITIYFDGSSSCTETKLLPEHAMYGEESILFGRP